MSQNSSEIIDADVGPKQPIIRHNWMMLVILPAWVFVGFFTAELLTGGLLWLAAAGGIALKSVNQSVLNAVIAAIVYLLTLAIVIIIPWFFRRRTIKIADFGLSRWPSWSDIFMTPAGFIVYIILSSLLILLATHILPGFNPNQVQNTGFEHLVQGYEYILAFTTLVIVAPIAEEILFRGYLFGKLKQYIPVWVAAIATSVLFGAIHGSWDVAVDTFALSLVLCYLRETTGSIWSSILLHMLKNGIAFYLLFIYPSLLTTLVR